MGGDWGTGEGGGGEVIVFLFLFGLMGVLGVLCWLRCSFVSCLFLLFGDVYAARYGRLGLRASEPLLVCFSVASFL